MEDDAVEHVMHVVVQVWSWESAVSRKVELNG